MKPTYLICQLSAKNKLIVIEKVTAEQLKQIEFNLALANKLEDEIRVIERKTGWTKETEEEFIKLHNTSEEKLSFYSPYDYIRKYSGHIVLPYTKILE